jgi:hypothetical protein
LNALMAKVKLAMSGKKLKAKCKGWRHPTPRGCHPSF